MDLCRSPSDSPLHDETIAHEHDPQLTVLLEQHATERCVLQEADLAAEYLATYRSLQSDMLKLAQRMALHLADEMHTTREEYEALYPQLTCSADERDQQGSLSDEWPVSWPEMDEELATGGGKRMSLAQFNVLLHLLNKPLLAYTVNPDSVVDALRDVLVSGCSIFTAKERHRVSDRVIRARLDMIRTAEKDIKALVSYYATPPAR